MQEFNYELPCPVRKGNCEFEQLDEKDEWSYYCKHCDRARNWSRQEHDKPYEVRKYSCSINDNDDTILEYEISFSRGGYEYWKLKVNKKGKVYKYARP